ncbi:MAG: hypothetical protein H0T51_05425 [Pirellulales bacterium]|nr:hypothetical protein [Pirellulales bacterium]
MVLRLVLLALAALCQFGSDDVCAQPVAQSDDKKSLEALLIEPDAVNAGKIAVWKKEGFSSLVLVLDERFDAGVYQKAAEAIATNPLDIYYWIEVGRNPALADEHSEWMASLGSHSDWRKLFPDVPELNEGEVTKAWPWTPIGYREAFEAHLVRIKGLLERIPPDYCGLLLNDLQGGPSSCGCGNLQCRWAIDYGVAATAEKLPGHHIAAEFVAKAGKLAPDKVVIPVWTTECDQEDMALEKQPKRDWTTGYCGDVDCFNYCLARFTEQWNALHATHQGPTGVLLLHKEFRRAGGKYGPAGSWITHAVQYLEHKELKTVPPQQLWLVVQGYDVTPAEEKATRQAASKTGAAMVVVARSRIDQSYEPRVVRVKAEESVIEPSRIP